MAFHHVSVLLEEAVDGLAVVPHGIYVDCTLGGGGHAARIASMLAPEGRLIGIDQDGAAVSAASERLQDARCSISIVRGNFRELDAILAHEGAGSVDGILFDLGVSSHQIDTPERGFSYMQDAPLDMRMDQRRERSAYDVVNTYAEEDLCRIFHDYGEERWAKRIAGFLIEARREHPVRTTGELVDIVRRAVPSAARRADHGHPAKRIFQALRIEVNGELGILEGAFRAAVSHLRPGGRIAIITFHSLEDRIAKQALRGMARGCICPPGLPVCACHHRPEIRLLGKARKPSRGEIIQNPRAASAKLRLAEKL